METNESIYAKSRTVENIKDCYFYQTVELPGFGSSRGVGFARQGGRIFGFVPLKEADPGIGYCQRVLVLRNGKRGADVVGYDLSEKDDWI